ncbi:MAG: DMT family transporter [Planctomycetota bacterium]
MSIPLGTATPPFLLAGELAAAACSLCWASAQIGFAGIRTAMTGSALNFGKNLVATTAFAVLFLVRTGLPWPTGLEPSPLLWLIASGVVGLGICDVFLMQALLRIGPQRTSLLFCLVPVLTVVLSALPPFHEHLTLLALSGMGLTLGGIVMAILERGGTQPPPHDMKAGIRDALLASGFQAVAILMVRQARREGDIDGASAAMVRLASGTAALVVYGLARRRLGSWWSQISAPTTRTRLGLSALVGTFVGIWLNQLSLQWTQAAGVAATLLALPPVFLLPLSAVFLGERRAAPAWIATGIAFAGVAMIAFGR